MFYVSLVLFFVSIGLLYWLGSMVSGPGASGLFPVFILLSFIAFVSLIIFFLSFIISKPESINQSHFTTIKIVKLIGALIVGVALFYFVVFVVNVFAVMDYRTDKYLNGNKNVHLIYYYLIPILVSLPIILLLVRKSLRNKNVQS